MPDPACQLLEWLAVHVVRHGQPFADRLDQTPLAVIAGVIGGNHVERTDSFEHVCQVGDRQPGRLQKRLVDFLEAHTLLGGWRTVSLLVPTLPKRPMDLGEGMEVKQRLEVPVPICADLPGKVDYSITRQDPPSPSSVTSTGTVIFSSRM